MSDKQSDNPPRDDSAIRAKAWLSEHADVLYRYARRRCDSPETAEDLVQETLLAAMEAWDTFEGGSTERTWLIGILRHKVLDHLRRLARDRHWADEARAQAEVGNPEFRNGYWARPQPAWPDISGDEAAELRDLVRQSLGRMPEPMRLAFTLREIDGIPSKMVCEVLGVTPTNLWTLVHRAKLRLRRDIQEAWLGEGSSEDSSRGSAER